MVNSNNICTRFINYAAVLILLCFSSLSFAGQFSGGGASGSWGDPQCTTTYNAKTAGGGGTGSSPKEACDNGLIAQNALIASAGASYRYLYFSNSDTSCTFMRNDGYVGNYSYSIINTTKCDDFCPDGYEKDINGKCQPKQCPVGQTLVNGKCITKQCPAGQALDKNGNCMPRDDQCPSGQKKVNGRCLPDYPKDPNDPPDPNDPNPPELKLPPFCEWASEMCKWHNEWIQWSNDYAANEEKANLDREELNRLALDSKEQLTEINSKQEAIKEAIQNQSLTLDQIKQQDKQFYDELRLWLNNFNPEQGTPSDQYPPVEFPEFCDWSVQVCNWYLDWKDWRTDYNSNNEDMKQKFEQHLQQLQEIKNQDQEHYQETKTFFERAKDFFDESLGFFDEIRQFLNQQGSEQNGDNSGEITPEEKEIPIDESQRITFVAGCPNGEQFTVSFMGSSQTMEFSYMPLCQFMSMIRPFVISIAYLIAAYIVMGLSRGSSE